MNPTMIATRCCIAAWETAITSWWKSLLRKYCSSSFPSKLFDYKGEEIRIYPMPDDSFLACYFTSDFLVVSYQKN